MGLIHIVIYSVKLLRMFHLVHKQVCQQSTFGKLEETNLFSCPVKNGKQLSY